MDWFTYIISISYKVNGLKKQMLPPKSAAIPETSSPGHYGGLDGVQCLHFLAGVLTLHSKGNARMDGEYFASSWGISNSYRQSVLGTLMFLNVWLIIWPKQQIVIASTNQVAEGGEPLPEAAECTAKAGLASRTNTLFSIPMLLMMGAASHFPVGVTESTSFSGLFWVLAIIIGVLEINAVIGKPGPMASVKGVITSGLVLTVVIFGVIGLLV